MTTEGDDEKPARVPRPPQEDLADQIESAVRAVMAGAAGLIPQPWGLILAAAAGYLAPLFPALGQRRLEKWGTQVARGVNDMQRRGVPVEALAQDETYTDLMLATTEVAMRTRHDDKRERLRNLLVNCALLGSATEARARMFVRLEGELDEHHIALLRFLGDPHEFLRSEGLPVEIVGLGYKVYEPIGALTARALQSFNEQPLIELAIDDLVRRSLTTFNASVECRPGHGVLTPLGRDFLKFISAPPPL